MKRILLLLILIVLSNISFAQTQGEMNAAEHNKYVNANKELNSVYQKILQEYKTDTGFIMNLKASQNIWMKFRDAEMKMKYPDREDGYYGTV